MEQASVPAAWAYRTWKCFLPSLGQGLAKDRQRASHDCSLKDCHFGVASRKILM